MAQGLNYSCCPGLGGFQCIMTINALMTGRWNAFGIEWLSSWQKYFQMIPANILHKMNKSDCKALYKSSHQRLHKAELWGKLTQTKTNTHTQTHPHLRKHTQTHTHTHTHKQAHTHTHTNAQAFYATTWHTLVQNTKVLISGEQFQLVGRTEQVSHLDLLMEGEPPAGMLSF
jgi:hypothetical protein